MRNEKNEQKKKKKKNKKKNIQRVRIINGLKKKKTNKQTKTKRRVNIPCTFTLLFIFVCEFGRGQLVNIGDRRRFLETVANKNISTTSISGKKLEMIASRKQQRLEREEQKRAEKETKQKEKEAKRQEKETKKIQRLQLKAEKEKLKQEKKQCQRDGKKKDMPSISSSSSLCTEWTPPEPSPFMLEQNLPLNNRLPHELPSPMFSLSVPKCELNKPGLKSANNDGDDNNDTVRAQLLSKSFAPVPQPLLLPQQRCTPSQQFFRYSCYPASSFPNPFVGPTPSSIPGLQLRYGFIVTILHKKIVFKIINFILQRNQSNTNNEIEDILLHTIENDGMGFKRKVVIRLFYKERKWKQ
ncbi:hypothetical protein RFI_28860, partial [Reticulomyxa filosa]